ncbi:hypothetical protein BASA81_008441 [Batrachochytrium salamandrivorans]|nr:hypothetical protein BASA81_008441 [Batrachochytrium salamandrivorans]
MFKSIEGWDSEEDSFFGDESEEEDSFWEDESEEEEHFSALPNPQPKPQHSLTWEQRVERVRLERLRQDLERIQESQRLDRMDAESRLTRELVKQALARERERIATETKLLREQRDAAKQVRLVQVESAKQYYRNECDLLREDLHRQRMALQAEEREHKRELRELQKEVRLDYEQRVRAHKLQLDYQHQHTKFANLDRITRQFY